MKSTSSSLGDILKSLGLVTDDDIKQARAIQEAPGVNRMFGEILVTLGKVSVDDIAKALTIQQEMRATSEEDASKKLLNAQLKERRTTNLRLAAICDG